MIQQSLISKEKAFFKLFVQRYPDWLIYTYVHWATHVLCMLLFCYAICVNKLEADMYL